MRGGVEKTHFEEGAYARGAYVRRGFEKSRFEEGAYVRGGLDYGGLGLKWLRGGWSRGRCSRRGRVRRTCRAESLFSMRSCFEAGGPEQGVLRDTYRVESSCSIEWFRGGWSRQGRFRDTCRAESLFSMRGGVDERISSFPPGKPFCVTIAQFPRFSGHLEV